MCEPEWNRALSVMALTSDADVSMPAFELQDWTFWPFIVTYISQNIVNCLKLRQNLLLNELFVSDSRSFRDIYFHKAV